MLKPKPPEHLSTHGRALWDEIAGKYQLRPDELRMLADACAASDMLKAFEDAWREQGYPLTTKGSMGQLVEHPLIGSIDKQRKARQSFLARLKLPDAPGGEKPNQQRSAAQRRWANRGASA